MVETARLLVVDDEVEIREILAEYLGAHGYTVIQAPDALTARRLMAEQNVALAILDVSMPGEDGLSLARHLRERHAVAIMMLTAAGDVIDRIVGLEIGADDYVSKPFDPREVLARVRAILRRVDHTATVAVPTPRTRIPFGRCLLDLAEEALYGPHGEPIALTPLEYALAKLFVERPNRVLSRDEILNVTPSADSEPFDRSVDVRINRLRRKIEHTPEKPEFIKTIRGGGYLYAVRPAPQ